MPKVTKLGIVAGREALESSGIELEGKKVGVFLGTSLAAVTDPIILKGVLLTIYPLKLWM